MKKVEEMSVRDVLLTDVFKEKMQEVIDGEIASQRKAMADAHARHMRLGRSAIDALRDKGVLEAEHMVDLFGSVLDGSLSGFSYRERWYIGVMGRVAYQRTIKKLQACSG